MKGLKALQSHFTFLSDDLKDLGRVATFKRTLSQDMDLLEKHLTKEILHQIDCKTALTKLKTMFEDTFNSELRENLQNHTALETFSVKDTIISDMDFVKKYMIETILHQQEIHQLLNEKKLQTQEVQPNIVQALKVDSVIMENTCSRKENSNLETAFSKSVKESNLDSKTKDVHAIKYKMVNKTQMQTQESMVNTGKALDAGLVVTESSGIESEVQDTSNRIYPSMIEVSRVWIIVPVHKSFTSFV
nr:hypothetical protein [Tanacetum cinerariifolium]